MTDITDRKFEVRVGNQLKRSRKTFDVQESHWGYTIKSASRPRFALIIIQAAAMVGGACLVGAGVGLVAMPSAALGSIDIMFRIVAATLLCAFGTYLLWFSSRGTDVETQIDTNLGEVREVVRNRAGRSNLLGRYGFDAIGSVFIDRNFDTAGNSALVMRYRNTPQVFAVAIGSSADLEPLRNRMGQDMIIQAVAANDGTFAAA